MKARTRNPELFGIVYKCTNRVNGKVYIGQTRKKLSYKVKDYYAIARGVRKPVRYFERALVKYHNTHGFDSAFRWETICNVYHQESEIESRRLLDTAEIAFIAYYCTTNHGLGYNIEEGGRGISADPSYSQNISGVHISEVYQMITQANYDVAAVAKKMGISTSHIHRSLRHWDAAKAKEVTAIRRRAVIQKYGNKNRKELTKEEAELLYGVMQKERVYLEQASKLLGIDIHSKTLSLKIRDQFPDLHKKIRFLTFQMIRSTPRKKPRKVYSNRGLRRKHLERDQAESVLKELRNKPSGTDHILDKLGIHMSGKLFRKICKEKYPDLHCLIVTETRKVGLHIMNNAQKMTN